MAKKNVWLGGDWASDWAAALSWLKQRADCRFIAPSELPDRTSEAPAAVVIAQSRPGDFPPHDLQVLQTAAGGAPLVLLAGPWCEGERRSGGPLADATRIEWRRWQMGLTAELEPLLSAPSAGQRPRYSLPADAQLIARNLRSVRQTKPACSAALILTDRQPLYHALADALLQFRIAAAGLARAKAQALATAQLVVYDGWPQVERHERAMDQAQPLRQLLLLDWPRPADAEQAKTAGIHAILPLPFLLSDLATALSAS